MLAAEHDRQVSGEAEDRVGEHERVLVAHLSRHDGVLHVLGDVGERHVVSLAKRRGEPVLAGGEPHELHEVVVLGLPGDGGPDAELDAGEGVGLGADRLALAATHLLLSLGEDLMEQLFLAVEVPVEDPFADTDLVHDVRDRCGVVSALGELPGGAVHELAAPFTSSRGELPGHRRDATSLLMTSSRTREETSCSQWSRTVWRMETYVVRLWLPDRPGALGAVTSRIGAVRGSVVGIEILERGAGRAIDELVVELPSDDLIELLIQEIGQVDGVDVEFIEPIAGAVHDPRLDALETAAILVGAATTTDLLDALCAHARRTIGSSWAAVVALEDGAVVASAGTCPAAPWLAAFVEGARLMAHGESGGPEDVVWAPMPASGQALVLGRVDTAFRALERRHVAALARIADTRFRELIRLRSRAAHPSVTAVRPSLASVRPL